MGNTFTDATLAEGGVGLCTLEQAKARLGIASANTKQDAVILALIESVLAVFSERYGREFMPRRTATRLFGVRDTLVHIGDLVSATDVTLNPDQPEERVLVADQDYTLTGDAPGDTMNFIRLSRSCSVASAFRSNFGFSRLTIEGTWGIWPDAASVAADVNEAALQTVVAWLNKGPTNIAGIDIEGARDLVAPLAATWDIPFSAHAKMRQWAVNVLGGTW